MPALVSGQQGMHSPRTSQHAPRRYWQHVIRVAFMLSLLVFPMLRVDSAAAAGAFVRQSPVSIVTSNSNSVKATLPAAATANNLLVLVCSAGTASTLSASGYTAAAAAVSGTVSQGIFYKVAAGGETTATCSSSVRTKAGLGAHMYEYSGMQVLSVSDTSGTANGTGTAVSSGSATPTGTSSLVFTAFTAAGGTAFNSLTAGYTKRADTLTTIHLGQADMFTTATTAQIASVTNTTSVAWRGQVAIFKVSTGTRWADIVDGSGNSVTSPSVGFADTVFDLSCHGNDAPLGTTTQKIRVFNTTSTAAWSVSIAATGGPTASWTAGGNNKFDFNDPTIDGCTDGADSDVLPGKLIVNPATGTITPSPGCANTGVTLSSSVGFSEGTQDSIGIVSANTSAQTGCTWDITGVTLTQYIPAEQNEGTYSLGLTLTFTAS